MADCSRRTALQTVLLSVMILILQGTICSLTSRSLNRIVIYFAPINGERPEAFGSAVS